MQNLPLQRYQQTGKRCAEFSYNRKASCSFWLQTFMGSPVCPDSIQGTGSQEDSSPILIEGSLL